MREAPFIAQGGRFLPGINMETYGNHLMLIRSFFPPKLGSFGANMGPADPVVRPAHEWRPSRRLSSWTLPIGPPIGKMASYATFQYNVLVIDIDNTTLGLI